VGTVFTIDGTHTLIDVVIANLVSQTISFQGMATMMVAQAKVVSYRN
jgi:hypothetical protein